MNDVSVGTTKRITSHGIPLHKTVKMALLGNFVFLRGGSKEPDLISKVCMIVGLSKVGA